MSRRPHVKSPPARSKPAHRALAIGSARVGADHRMVTLRPPAAKRHQAVALVRIVGIAAGQVETCWHDLLDSDTADGAHKFRVAVRRLRVLLHVLRHVVAGTGLKQMRTSLASAARIVGRLRDLDVLVDDIVAPLLGFGAPPGAAVLLAALNTERIQTRATICAALAAPDMIALRNELPMLPMNVSADIVISGRRRQMRKLARRDLKKRWRNFSRRARDLEGLPPDALHEARKSLKSLRYALAQFAPYLKADDVAGFRKCILRLQDTFGYLNDVESVKALTCRLSAAAMDADIHCAAGFVLGVHTERARRARRKLAAQYKKLAATRMARALAAAQ